MEMWPGTGRKGFQAEERKAEMSKSGRKKVMKGTTHLNKTRSRACLSVATGGRSAAGSIATSAARRYEISQSFFSEKADQAKLHK